MAYDSDKPSTKTESQVEARVKAMIQDSLTYHTSELARFRIKAGKYYRGEPFGDEEDGRSKIVLTEVRDAVLQQLPSLMRVFFGPDGAVEFVARRPDAVALAEQQTDYINHVFNEDNPGFFISYAAFKDAMVRRLGIIKWWWEEKEVVESERLSGLTEEELTAMLSEDPKKEIEKDSLEASEEGTISVVIRRKGKRGRVRIEAVPPEEFIYNRSARSIEDAVFVAHVTTKTVGELIQMGYKKSELEDVATSDARLVNSEERDARRPRGASTYVSDASNEGENAELSYVEAYVRMDFGDGIEHKKMCFVGAGLKLLNTEPATDRPFAVFTPDPEPHEIQGLSLSDMSMDLQLINSHVARGVLNSLNLSLNPRTVFDGDRVNVKDLMNVEIGAMIRATGDVNAVKELTHSFVGAEGLGVLEFFKGVKEERMGTSRASVGLNPDALQSSTASAVDATVGKAEARTELMARVFAENMKTLFRGIYNLERRHRDEARIVRLRGAYIKVDPRNWPPDPDVSVRVGIGSGTRQEKLAYIAATLEKQEMVMQQLGSPNNVLTDLRRYRHMLAEGIRLLGYDPSMAWKEVTDETVQQMEQEAAQQPQQEDPATELAKAQIQAEQMKLQNDSMKLQMEQEYKMAQLEFQRWNAKMQDDRERDKAEADIAVRLKEMELKYMTTIDSAQIKADMEREREELKQGGSVLQSMMQMEPEEAVDPATEGGEVGL